MKKNVKKLKIRKEYLLKLNNDFTLPMDGK